VPRLKKEGKEGNLASAESVNREKTRRGREKEKKKKGHHSHRRIARNRIHQLLDQRVPERRRGGVDGQSRSRDQKRL